MEGVVVTKMRTVVGVGDSTIVAVVAIVSIVAVVAVSAPIVRSWLLLPTRLLLLPLSLLGVLRPRLLCVLRLRLVLCLLCVLWLSLMLCLLGVLRLCLMLSLRCVSSATALFLFVFLCECRNGSAEEH